MPKIIPLDAVEDSEDNEADDGMRIEAVVLKMTWDTFEESVAFADDEEEIEELLQYEKEPEEPTEFSDDTKLVGWYTSDAVAHHIQKVHRAIKKLTLRQADFDCHVDNLAQMMEYSQNPDMAWQLAVAIRGHGHDLDSEDEEIVEEAAKKFDKICWEMREAEKSRERFISDLMGLKGQNRESKSPESKSSEENLDPQSPIGHGPPVYHQYQFQNRQQFLEDAQHLGLAPPSKLARRHQPIQFPPELPEYDLEPQEYPDEPGFLQKPQDQRRLRGRLQRGAHRLQNPQHENQEPHFGQAYMDVNSEQQVQISGRRLDAHFPHHDTLTQYDDIEHPEEPQEWVAPRAKGSRGSSHPGRCRVRRARGSAY